MYKIFIDTNKYLDFYRYKEENTEILKKLSESNNIIITEQVIREFKRNKNVEISRILDKVRSKEKSINVDLCNIEPVGIFTDEIIDINKSNTSMISSIKSNFSPLIKKIDNMLQNECDDPVFSSFNSILCNEETLIIKDTDEAFNLAERRNRLGGVPRSDKSDSRFSTLCDEYIWESLLLNSKDDILFVTRDKTYLENRKLLMDEYKEKTGKTIEFVDYISTALTKLGEKISNEAIEKEKEEQINLSMLQALQDATGLDDDELEKSLLRLTKREDEIIKLRYGIDGGEMKTLQEVGDMLGLTREQVRTIEAKALRKMRHILAENNAGQNIIVSL